MGRFLFLYDLFRLSCSLGVIPSEVAASFGRKVLQIFYFKCNFFHRVSVLLTRRSTTGIKTCVTSLFEHHVSDKFVSEVGARGRAPAANAVLSPAACLTPGRSSLELTQLTAPTEDRLDVISRPLATTAVKRSTDNDKPRGVTFDLGAVDPGACFRTPPHECANGHDTVATWTMWFGSRINKHNIHGEQVR